MRAATVAVDRREVVEAAFSAPAADRLAAISHRETLGGRARLTSRFLGDGRRARFWAGMGGRPWRGRRLGHHVRFLTGCADIFSGAVTKLIGRRWKPWLFRDACGTPSPTRPRLPSTRPAPRDPEHPKSLKRQPRNACSSGFRFPGCRTSSISIGTKNRLG